MKTILRKVGLLYGLAVFLTGCSEDTIPEQPDTDTWNVALTRSATDGSNVTVALRYEGFTSYGILIPASQEGETATWEKETEWPTDENTQVEVITFCPAVETLPETIGTDAMYKMDYIAGASVNNKPKEFAFTHLLAQLEVHIKISDNEQHYHTPTEGAITLYQQGEVDYPNEKLINPQNVSSVSLGTFGKEGESTETVDNWVNKPQLVIPQTLEAGEPCLTFKAGDKTYTFTPEEDIVLKPGKKTKLYLGVAYENDYIVLDGEGVTVTAWDNGEDFGNKEAE